MIFEGILQMKSSPYSHLIFFYHIPKYGSVVIKSGDHAKKKLQKLRYAKFK
jgi:hypothetical protein